MKRLRMALRLSPADWWQLVSIYGMLALVRLRPPHEDELQTLLSVPDVVQGDPGQYAIIKRTAWLVEAAARMPFPWASCLHQSIALHRLLSGRGIQTRLHIGVRRPAAGNLEAHAWLAYAGRSVLGLPAPETRFVPLTHTQDTRTVERFR